MKFTFLVTLLLVFSFNALAVYDSFVPIASDMGGVEKEIREEHASTVPDSPLNDMHASDELLEEH